MSSKIGRASCRVLWRPRLGGSWNMNRGDGLAPARPVASGKEDLAGPTSRRDEDITDRWRPVGATRRDGLEDRPQAWSVERPQGPALGMEDSRQNPARKMASRHGLRPRGLTSKGRPNRYPIGSDCVGSRQDGPGPAKKQVGGLA